MKKLLAKFFALVAVAIACPDLSAETRLIVAIPDYLQTNNVVSARRSMTEALLKAGLLPVVMPEMDDDSADQFLAHCDAVMIGGGIPGQQYNRRCDYEDRILTLATKRGMTIVGICHGCQVINKHFGGTIVPVPEGSRLVHKNADHFTRTGERAEHEVNVASGPSLMSELFGEGRLRVNSSHTQRCGALAPGFRVTASAEDGVIESIEHERLPIFGFQFHPEIYWQKDSRFLELIRKAFHSKKK